MQERQLTDSAFSFYTLTADWLLRQASPSYAEGQAPDVPLPQEAPMALRVLPVRPFDLADKEATIICHSCRQRRINFWHVDLIEEDFPEDAMYHIDAV